MDYQLTLGDRLKVRTMIYVASEPIPRFWPMRTFIHHNPLFGLEHLPFEDAVEEAGKLFHGRGYLSRSEYQEYWQAGKVDEAALRKYLQAFLVKQGGALPSEIPMEHWLWSLLTLCKSEQLVPKTDWLNGTVLHAALHGQGLDPDTAKQKEQLQEILAHKIALDGPVYANVDRLFGTDIGSTLDDLLVKSCLDFFDEGQSAWQSPGRKQGFFTAWKEVAQHNVRFFLRGLHLRQLLESEQTPEGVVAHILRELQVPEASWQKYITRQLTRLHGWAGFIRYRSTAKHYYWAEQYPADLTDFLAVRMVLGMALLQEAVRHQGCPANAEEIQNFVHADPLSAYLRLELYTGAILPAWAQQVEDMLARRKRPGFDRVAEQYIAAKTRWEGERQARNLLRLAKAMGAEAEAQLLGMSPEQLDQFLNILRAWEKGEGFCWLRSMESHYIKSLVNRINIPHQQEAVEKRPFAQALMCIDVRSEPMRRHLEAIGDYQTFGIGGFFGVPISFLEYGRGTEVHLCPAIQTPKNLVVEIPAELELEEEPLYGALEHVLHELKSSVLSPFVAVEAVGLIFSLGLIGKTVAPLTYHHLHNKLHAEKPVTRLLLDKLSPDQADSILRAVQRAMIVRALIKEWNVPRDQVTDDDVKELREIALEHISRPSALARRMQFSAQQEAEFIQKLRDTYRVERHESSLQMERLGRIGFSLDEQVRYISQALLLIGMNRNFSRFVLLVGHESETENNPYESALDCGACGGGKGLPNARVFAAMANKPEVRRRLRDKGIVIPDDTWFLPAVHNTTSDAVELFDLDLLPARHLLYLERLRNGLSAATRRSAAERMPSLGGSEKLAQDPYAAAAMALRQTHDWSQVRPEWGLTRNVYAIVGRRELTAGLDLESRAFLHSYDYRLDPKGRLLETILASPMVVGEWINLEHYFSVVDTEHYGSGSKVYHNVAGRFAVMTGNQSDLRTGLPTQTVLKEGKPYHEPVRLIVLVEAPVAFAQRSVGNLVKIKALLGGGWVRVILLDPEDAYRAYVLEDGAFHLQERSATPDSQTILEEIA